MSARPAARVRHLNGKAKIQKSSPQNPGNAVRDLAKASIQDFQLLHATAACSTLRMAELRPQEMSNSARRPTKLGFRRSPPMDALATEVVKLLARSPGHIPLLQATSGASLQLLGQFNSQDLANSAQSFATCRFMGSGTMGSQSSEVLVKLPELAPQASEPILGLCVAMADPAGDSDVLPAQDKVKFTEAFNVWDKHQQGYIPWKPDFASLWRSIGQNPTEGEIRRIIEENDTGTGHFQLETFLKLCESREDALRKEQLIEAFKTFDKDGKGTITLAQFRYVLMQLGDPLDDEEADQFIEFADKNKEGPSAEIDYEDLVERLDTRDQKF
ncbi:unnamed protein product [Symbiodinium sp. KB8]|nr:unnamed protein product [Symbiodinium sp. KB8]